jgi:hypothetical protein
MCGVLSVINAQLVDRCLLFNVSYLGAFSCARSGELYRGTNEVRSQSSGQQERLSFRLRTGYYRKEGTCCMKLFGGVCKLFTLKSVVFVVI